jgi:galactokinase/mevalonate kinase-like predicted kinase
MATIASAESIEGISGYELVEEKELTRRIANGEITDAFTLALYAGAVAGKLISAE